MLAPYDIYNFKSSNKSKYIFHHSFSMLKEQIFIISRSLMGKLKDSFIWKGILKFFFKFVLYLGFSFEHLIYDRIMDA